MLNIGSLFSGIGGFEKGLELANVGKTIWCSEIDKYAYAIYKYHYPEVRNYGNAIGIEPAELPETDIITFGWPCQDNSIAGKRKGHQEGTRSSLLTEAVRIIGIEKTKYFIAENVPGLFSVNGGNDFYKAIRMFTDIGYDCQWQVLNTGEHGLPQNRPRIIFIGHIRGESRPEIFPITPSSRLDKKTFSVCCTARGYGAQRNGTYIITRPHGFNKGGIKNTVCLRSSYGWLNELCLQEDGIIRQLTPIECERLQGFPDNFTKWGLFDDGIKEISDSQRYKCLGNAVSVPVSQAIGEKLMEWINESEQSK